MEMVERKRKMKMKVRREKNMVGEEGKEKKMKKKNKIVQKKLTRVILKRTRLKK